jgi:NitT/TauT family transport system ATP-binding protein
MRPATARRMALVPDPALASAKLAVRDVARVYRSARGGKVSACTDVSFEVHPGEFVCILGPSGCGKSTLLNMLAGLDRPDRGEALIDGRAIAGPGPDRAVLFQEPALFPWMSVAGNVEFALKFVGVPKSERRDRTMHWLAKVQLSRFAEAQPHELSGGMRQRAALARALACEPEVLLADEPFAALDAQTREILQAELQRVWLETGKTVVFVTHNVREAAFLADRVLLMSAPPGTIVEDRAIDVERPRNVDDPALARVVAGIHGHLIEEVNKVVAREIGPA